MECVPTVRGGQRGPRTRWWQLGVEVLVAFVLFCRMLQILFFREKQEVPELRGDLWPFHVAACHFALQFVISGIVTLSLSSFELSARSKRVQLSTMMGEMIFLSRIQEVTAMMSSVGFITALHYVYLAFGTRHCIGTAGWFPGVDEPRYLCRYLLWSVSAPAQCTIVSRLCTIATPVEIVRILIPTIMVILLGFHASAGHGIKYAAEVLPPYQWHRMCFVLACAWSVPVFTRLRALSPEPTHSQSWKLGQGCLLFIWILAPSVQLLRSLQLISGRSEEIGFACVDTVAKTLIALSVTSRSVIHNLSSIMFSAQIVNAHQDLTLQVDNPGWTLSMPTSGQDAAMIENLLGSTLESCNFLEDFVQDESQRRALLRAAEQADHGRTFTAQKVCATLLLPNGQQRRADCLVSRSLYGCRQISLMFRVEDWRDQISDAACGAGPRARMARTSSDGNAHGGSEASGGSDSAPPTPARSDGVS